jgi:hypothetical protein
MRALWREIFCEKIRVHLPDALLKKLVDKELKAKNRAESVIRCAYKQKKKLEEKNKHLKNHLRTLQDNAVSFEFKYPKVSLFIVPATETGDGIPPDSGIYFVWENGAVVYVGQSINLGARCRLGHHAIRNGDKISFVLVPKNILNFAESFYIGLLRPIRNYGKKADHLRN